MELPYHDLNQHEYELVKHVSLLQLNPLVLLQLRTTSRCTVRLSEALLTWMLRALLSAYQDAWPLPPLHRGALRYCGCTMTLTNNHLRKEWNLLAKKYVRDLTIDDPRFRDEIAAIQSIATSNAQNDHGMIEFNFRDERYLPFEGAGAISFWHIKLNKDLPQFNFYALP